MLRVYRKAAFEWRCRALRSATIFWAVDQKIQAKKFFVSGGVQGVGFRFYTQRAAAKLRVGGFVRNLRDGRVEVFVMGTEKQLDEMRGLLERGPTFSSVSGVTEETAPVDSRYGKVFEIADTAD
jgi:acylphosphatase